MRNIAQALCWQTVAGSKHCGQGNVPRCTSFPDAKSSLKRSETARREASCAAGVTKVKRFARRFGGFVAWQEACGLDTSAVPMFSRQLPPGIRAVYRMMFRKGSPGSGSAGPMERDVLLGSDFAEACKRLSRCPEANPRSKSGITGK